MNKPKITFGAIKLNVNKPPETTEKKEENPETATKSDESPSVSGFGKFSGVPSRAIEDLTIEESETEKMKQVMGFSGFERKSKNFDINEMLKKARENAPKPKFLQAGQEEPDEDVVGPMPAPVVPEKIEK
jgi:hypothetical protein